MIEINLVIKLYFKIPLENFYKFHNREKLIKFRCLEIERNWSSPSTKI